MKITPMMIVMLTLALLRAPSCLAAPADAQTTGTASALWELACARAGTHRFSTLFTAHDVKNYLATDKGIDEAIAWCKKTGVTRVFLEAFRGRYQAERAVLEHARDRFRQAGILVSGGVTTTNVGKSSTGWRDTISCYTDRGTQERLSQVFEFTAGLFDEIMIDDFWFTDCTCPQCDVARKTRTVTIGEQKFSAPGDSWDEYRCELLVQLSRLNILAPARKVNPRVKIILKYPQWYDLFHERGYEVEREAADFDMIWAGTETRDYTDKRWGGTPQYEGYFVMRWLGDIGGGKCGGGWFDPFGTTAASYIEQARQTVLGGARESMLFCYHALQRDTGPANVEALRKQIPELLAVAGEVGKRQPTGIAAYKPIGSHPENEQYVYDFVGMLGLPLIPCHEFPVEAPAAFFPIQSLKDQAFTEKLAKFIATGKPVLLTDGLANQLGGKVDLNAPNVHLLEVKGDPRALLNLPPDKLDPLRAAMMKPFGVHFKAPARVACYLFKDGSWVIENFNDQPVEVRLGRTKGKLEGRSWKYQWK